MGFLTEFIQKVKTEASELAEKVNKNETFLLIKLMKINF